MSWAASPMCEYPDDPCDPDMGELCPFCTLKWLAGLRTTQEEPIAVRWFGESWNASVNEETPQGPTPTGYACVRCHVPIEQGDRGVIIIGATLDPDAIPLTVREVIFHLRCFLVSVVGDVGYQMANDVERRDT